MPLSLRPCLLTILSLLAIAALAASPSARATEARSSLYLLLPTSVSETSLMRPGELREQRFLGERLLPLGRGLHWQTLTDLKRTRYEELYPVQAQAFNLSTGPRLKVGELEIAMPFNETREANGFGGTDAWRSTSPRVSLALGPRDNIRLEARVSRSDAALTRTSRRWTSIVWRHKLSDQWTLNTGLSHALSIGDTTSSVAEAHAGVDAAWPGRLSWSLTSRFSGATYGSSGNLDAVSRQQTASLSLATRYPLHGGWWLGGELRTAQTDRGDGMRPVSTQSGGVRLFRSF